MALVLITGCSSGIGLVTALELARAGHRVIATMRNPAGSPELARQAAAEGLAIEVRPLDVDSDVSVTACFASVTEPVDVLVNNAGIEVHGSVEELSIESIAAVMNTNYLGAVRCMKAVLPQMRQRGAGCIVNVSSISGRIANTPFGAYSASKFALEAMSEALAGEVKPFGIRLALVEPGIQNTRMVQNIKETGGSVYPQVNRFPGLYRAALAHPTPPSATAAVIRGVIESGTGQLRHPSGPDAAPFLAWRASQTDEQWIDWNAQDDESWYQALERDFGLNARPKSSPA